MPEFNPQEIRAVAGLGNPGNKYTNTYHNVGHEFIDLIAENEEFNNVSNKKFLYLKKQNMILLKNNNFMNKSGIAIKEAMDYFNIKPSELAIVHDDSDIALGKFKISFARGSAGHKGIKSINNNIKTRSFWRIRIGIRKEDSTEKAGSFVLDTISDEDKEEFKQSFQDMRHVLNFGK